MSRKHPLKESLSENIGPPTKRCRFENFDVRLLSHNDRRDSLTSSTPVDEFGESSFRIIRNAGSKRKKPNGSGAIPTTDENDITDLIRRFKKARIRPVFFTISTFVEQTVDDVQVTVGDDFDDNRSHTDTDNTNNETEVSSSFTFILPSPRNSSNVNHLNPSELCDNDSENDSKNDLIGQVDK